MAVTVVTVFVVVIVVVVRVVAVALLVVGNAAATSSSVAGSIVIQGWGDHVPPSFTSKPDAISFGACRLRMPSARACWTPSIKINLMLAGFLASLKDL